MLLLANDFKPLHRYVWKYYLENLYRVIVSPKIMKRINLDHQELNNLVRFTDPLIHSPEKEEEILLYFETGKLRPPSLIEHDKKYLVFNGNHRVLVAIAHKLAICCIVLENLDDVSHVQDLEGDQYRDISMVSPLTFEGVIIDLIKSAQEHDHQDPERYTFRDYVLSNQYNFREGRKLW